MLAPSASRPPRQEDPLTEVSAEVNAVAAPARSGSLQVTIVDSLDGFAGLRAGWEDCLGASSAASAFCTFEWLYNWWTHYGRGRRLRILLVRRDDQVVGLLPAYLDNWEPIPGIKGSILRFVGIGGDTAPNYLMPILRDDHQDEVGALVAQWIAFRLEWDILHLSELPAGSPFIGHLTTALGSAGIRMTTETSSRIPFARLPGSWERYLETRHGRRRNSIRRHRRRLARALPYEVLVWRKPDNVERAITELTRLHQLRWRGRVEGYSFKTPTYVAFHRAVMSAFAQRDWLRVYCLAEEGRPFAISYCLRFRGETAYFQSGFDPGFGAWRPGYVLMGHAIEHAANEGSRAFDMLKGDHPHKRIWAPETRITLAVRAVRRSGPGLAYAVRHRLLPRLKRLVVGAIGWAGRRPQSAARRRPLHDSSRIVSVQRGPGPIRFTTPISR